MLRWLQRDPIRRLQAEYESKLEEARDEQRRGDIVRFAELTAEAERIAVKLDAARAAAKPDQKET